MNHVRKVVAVALTLVVQGAALTGPLVHAHPDERVTGHHDGRTVHAHFAGHRHSHHSSDQPVLRAGDEDRAVFLEAFVAVAVLALGAPGLTPALTRVSVAPERRAHRVAEVVRSHDPPPLHSLSSRAPPAFLS